MVDAFAVEDVDVFEVVNGVGVDGTVLVTRVLGTVVEDAVVDDETVVLLTLGPLT